MTLTLRDGLLKFRVIFALFAGSCSEVKSSVGEVGDGRPLSFLGGYLLVSGFSSRLSSSKVSLLGAGVKLWLNSLPGFLVGFDFSLLIERAEKSLLPDANWMGGEEVLPDL